MVVSDPLVLLLRKSGGECRQLESHVSMTFINMQQMNYKCQPVALDLEQTINMLAWRMLVEEPSRYMDQISHG